MDGSTVLPTSGCFESRAVEARVEASSTEELLSVETERIDDIPPDESGQRSAARDQALPSRSGALLVKTLEQMGIPQIIDSAVHPHGNRCGLSVGWLTTAWLTYILSESDHRMCEVEGWAETRMQTLNHLLPSPVNSKDFTDDRLASVLHDLSDDATWQSIEHVTGQRLIRVYHLPEDTVRLDSTTVSVYHNTEETELFRLGHSKDHRPDLPQLKVMLATLDPLGLPLATLPMAGNCVDGELYLPAIEEAVKIIGAGGRLYIGDAKMGEKKIRATIANQGDYYLTPLAMNGKVPELKATLLSEFLAGQHPIETIRMPVVAGQDTSSSPILALGFEIERTQREKTAKAESVWQERVLAIYSPTLAKTARQAFSLRLQRAEEELLALTPPRGCGKRQWTSDAKNALDDAVAKILKQYRVEAFLSVESSLEVERSYIRTYKGRPPRYEQRSRYVVHVKRKVKSITAARLDMGWRLYATNAPASKLTLEKAVFAYRDSPLIERNFARLKGKSLGIGPLYVQREDHVKGMVRLLSLALRLLTLMEYVVRRRLVRLGKSLSGLYAGNPKRQTQQPTTERLLKAFSGITLTRMIFPSATQCHMTSLTPVQESILRLLGFSKSLYTQLLEQEPPPQTIGLSP